MRQGRKSATVQIRVVSPRSEFFGSLSLLGQPDVPARELDHLLFGGGALACDGLDLVDKSFSCLSRRVVISLLVT